MLNSKGKKEKNKFLSRLSKNLVTSLRLASLVALQEKRKKVSPKYLFVGLLLNRASLAGKVVSETRISKSDLLESVMGKKNISVDMDKNVPVVVNLSESLKEVLNRAFYIALKSGHVYVGTEHAMLALLEGNFKEFEDVKKLGLTLETFRNVLSQVAIYPIGMFSRPSDPFFSEEGQGLMEFLGVDLVELAKEKKLDPVIGRDKELKQLANILGRRKKNNPIIVGEAGVGKTVLVEGLAQMIADGHVGPSLKGTKIVSINISDIMAGSKMRGDVEEKVMAIIDEVVKSEDTILFIDEIHQIVAPGMPGSSADIASVLKPALTTGNFRCIGATTVQDYNAYFETDSALSRRFQPLFLDELSVDATVEVLKRIRPLLQKYHNVKISDEALNVAANLTDRYVVDRYLPDKAIDVLDEAAASRKLGLEDVFKDIDILKEELQDINSQKDKSIEEWNMEEALQKDKAGKELQNIISLKEKEYLSFMKDKTNEITGEDIRQVISKWTGIPLNTLGSKEKNALLLLDKELKKKVIGQDEACENVANAVKRARTGIIDTDRPWASFLFLGPTGVGKTELAKVLAGELFGDRDRLIQIDMSEMMEMHSVSKLIGSPPGYVGFQQGGRLTEEVKRYPHSVILFDEIEKAHPEVLNILLQILEYGHLTDGKGKRVNFKNSVIILTSNIGAEEIAKSKVLGFNQKHTSEEKSDREIDDAYSSMKDQLMEALQDTLRPELLNRLDDIVIFRALTRKDARKIVMLLVEELNSRLVEEKIVVKLDSKALTYIVKNAFSERYGARPLRRFIQEKIENLLANHILTEGENKEKEILTVTREGDELVIKK
jgi:ATP-dependent Clp protease ATP-binding subunit ClpC